MASVDVKKDYGELTVSWLLHESLGLNDECLGHGSWSHVSKEGLPVFFEDLHRSLSVVAWIEYLHIVTLAAHTKEVAFFSKVF